MPFGRASRTLRARASTCPESHDVVRRTILSTQGIALAIWDTRGLEVSDFQQTLGGLRRLVDQRDKESDPQSRIYCSIVAHVCFPSDCL